MIDRYFYELLTKFPMLSPRHKTSSISRVTFCPKTRQYNQSLWQREVYLAREEYERPTGLVTKIFIVE